MNGIYEQNDNPNVPTGMVPYVPAVVGTETSSDGLLQIVWRGKWLILLSSIVAGAAAHGYLRTLPKIYTSTSRVLVEKVGRRDTPDMPREVGTTSTNFLQTQAILLASPAVIAEAMRDPDVLPLLARHGEDYAQQLVRTLFAVVGRNSDVIHISASSADPADAATIVNAVVSAYFRWHGANREMSALELLEMLNEQFAEVSRELERKRGMKRAYEDQHPEVLEGFGSGVTSQTLELLRRELAAAHVAVMERKSVYDAVRKYEWVPDLLWQYAQNSRFAGTVPGLDGERVRAEEELHGIDAQLEEIEAGIKAVPRSRIEFLKNRRAQLEERIAQLDKHFAQSQIVLAQSALNEAVERHRKLGELYQEAVKGLSTGARRSEYAMIVEECHMLENVSTTLLQKIRDLDINSRIEGLKIHVLERAVPGDTPSSPHVARILGGGLVLGLIVGGGLAFFNDWRDQRIRSADEIVAILGTPILGTIPTIPMREILRRERKAIIPASHELEAYRAICTALFFGARSHEGKTLVITSPAPGEGKTTLVMNLAIAMAEAGQKTLIVDADLRQPLKHRVFAGESPNGGLTDLLAGKQTLDHEIRATEVPKLDVLGGGQMVSNPSGLLSSDALGALLKQLEARYDRILIDSPPVGVVADAQILAARCAMTLLVLRADKSSRSATQRARDALSTVSARVVGAVVTAVPRKDIRYSHCSYGGYGYGHSGNGSHSRKQTRKELPPDANPQPENKRPAAEARPDEKCITQQLFTELHEQRRLQR